MSQVFALLHLINGMPRGLLKQGPKSVLRVLAEHADAKRRCWPSQALLAQAVECDVRSVRRHLRALEAAGFVTVQQRGLHGNRYTIHEAAIRQACAAGTPFASVPRGTVPDKPDKVTGFDTGQIDPPNRTNHADIPDTGVRQNHQEPPRTTTTRAGARGRGGVKVLMREGKALADRLERDHGIRCQARWPDLAQAYRTHGEFLIDRLAGWSRQHGLAKLDDTTLREATEGTRSAYGGYDIVPLPRQGGAA